MRTLNSGKNFLVTISLMVTMTLLGFVTRKLFVNEIGVEYLGLNGLLTNILACHAAGVRLWNQRGFSPLQASGGE